MNWVKEGDEMDIKGKRLDLLERADECARILGHPKHEASRFSFLSPGERGVAVEVNGALPRLDPPAAALAEAVQHDVKILLTSDAHDTSELSLVDYAARHAFKARVASLPAPPPTQSGQ